MKKTLTVLAFALLSFTTWAYDFQVDQLCYNILSETEVEVTFLQDPSSGVPAYTSLSGSITIPSTVTNDETTYTVTSIGYEAFKGCSSLTAIAITEGASSIGGSAFRDCSSLTSVTIPNTITNMGNSAFYGCSSLTSITIPNSIISIGDDAFRNCSSISSTYYTGSIAEWCAIDFEDYDSNPTAFTHNLYINGNLLTEIIIPDGITEIKNYVFDNCSSLTSVTIPSSVTNIGVSSFYGCSSLSSITIPSNVTSIGDWAFRNCSSLTTITIPNSVTSIGNYVFEGCSSLSTVYWNAIHCNDFDSRPGWSNVSTFVIGEGVEHIPANLCYGLSLTSVTIPNSVTNIGENAFKGVREMYVYKNYSSEEALNIAENPSLDTIICPASDLNQITEEQLLTCSKQVKSITVHSGQLDANGFTYVTRQKKTLCILDMENTTNTELTDMAVYDCYKLHTIKLPSTLEYIGYKAVAECRMLQEITIPASVSEIDDSAFENCRSLSAIYFGGTTTPEGQASYAPAASESTLQRIGNWAFYNCHQLQELTIPEGVTEIGDAAFYGCTYLEDLVLPSSLQSIGDNCFALCAKLQQITVQSTTPPTIESKTFYDVKRTIPVYVPEGTLESYQNDTYWSEFLLQEGESTTSLSQIQDDQTGCYTANGMLHNPNGISLCIYTMQGTLVYTGNAAGIQMPSQGIYILKTPTATSKVIL